MGFITSYDIELARGPDQEHLIGWMIMNSEHDINHRI